MIGEDSHMAEYSSKQSFDDVFMTDPRDRSTDIADLLKWSYALHLRPVISEVAQKHCNGCYFDHPSQLEHDVCILMPFADQVNQWFDDALSIVDMDVVIGNWLGNLGGFTPSVRYHEVSRYLDPDYRMNEWIDTQWKDDVKDKLIALEHHPF